MHDLARMIFNRFFTPKHQHQDPKVRIQAIGSLSRDDLQQKRVLHELAFNDADASVVIAALTQLDNFALWCKAADTSDNERVVKKARQTVEQVLLNEEGISREEKVQFVRECTQNPLLELLLNEHWLKNDEPDLAFDVLTRLNKPQVTQKIAIATSSPELQRRIVESTNDISTLNRYGKKFAAPEIVEVVKKRVSALEAKKAKPFQVTADAKLLLSKLQALRDTNDYAQASASRQALAGQYEGLQSDFEHLREEVSRELDDKYKQISEKVQAHLESLRPAYEKQQSIERHSRQIDQLEEALSALVHSVSDMLKGDVTSVTLGDVEETTRQLVTVQEALIKTSSEVSSSHPLLSKRIEDAINQSRVLQRQLTHLPGLQQAITQADELLIALDGLSLPVGFDEVDEAESTLKTHLHGWKALKAEFATLWPEDREQAFTAWRSRWKSAIKTLRDDLQDKTSRCRSKLRVIERLIEQGRFKAAMSNWKKLQVWYGELPDSARHNLSRSYEKAKTSVENLQDWQMYIASPRKPLLVEQAKALADNPSKNIEEQAASVKRLRNEWSSLGAPGMEDDAELASEFDSALEKAFEPCRAYYDQQQKIRNQNLTEKMAIIQSCVEIASDATDDDALFNAYNTLRSRWRSTGHVDFEKREEVNEAYQQALQPIKEKVAHYLSANGEKKLQLIKRAEALAEVEDIQEAAARAIELQEQWKAIKSAGKRQDNQLWKAFRVANDTVFEKRNAERDKREEAFKQDAERVANLIEGIEASLTTSEKTADLTSLNEQISELESELEPKRNRAAVKRLSSLRTQVAERLRETERARNQSTRDDVFSVLSQWQTAQLPESVSTLPSEWKLCFTELSPAQKREDITVKMELIADRESPPALQQRRRELQLQLLAEKLENGQEYDLSGLLKDWIKQGPLSSDDLQLLERVKALF